ncbi:FtsX-like permease family protein [candidate division KSB1 bacterium]|nr:FtsX-like permease family protein [candidate division KSB1 bacterium]
MTIFKLALKEIQRRKMNFALGLFSVTLAIATLIGALSMLKVHDIRTTEIIARKEEETRQRMLVLEDDYRKIMKKLGFNLLILPAEQNLADLYEEDFSSRYMPEDFVNRLAASDIVTIQHLLPSLQQRIFWPEKKRNIILMGTRGEVPFQNQNLKEPMLLAVPPGKMVVGYELHQTLGLKVGEKVKLFGQTFTIHQCNEERGNKDDITIWIDLATAQKMLNRPGQINAILALKCLCAGNNLAQIRKQVSQILPGTQVVEEGTKVITRAEARIRAKEEAQEAIEAEKVNRANIRREQEAFASVLVPVVLLANGIWIALLFLGNIRERRSEIGILRAIGITSKRILYLFLSKALVLGLAGAFLGFGLGVIFTLLRTGLSDVTSFLDIRLFLLALLIAPLLSFIASWIPALLASQQDPALIMREE